MIFKVGNRAECKGVTSSDWFIEVFIDRGSKGPKQKQLACDQAGILKIGNYLVSSLNQRNWNT